MVRNVINIPSTQVLKKNEYWQQMYRQRGLRSSHITGQDGWAYWSCASCAFLAASELQCLADFCRGGREEEEERKELNVCRTSYNQILLVYRGLPVPAFTWKVWRSSCNFIIKMLLVPYVSKLCEMLHFPVSFSRQTAWLTSWNPKKVVCIYLIWDGKKNR